VISADSALRALAAGLPEMRTGVTITEIADDGRQVTVRTAGHRAPGGPDDGIVTARVAVVCTGPWTSGLLAATGIAVPLAATLEQVGYLAPAGDSALATDSALAAHPARAADPESTTPSALPIIIGHGGDQPYGLPVPGTALYKIGYHHSGPPVDPARQEQRPDGQLTARLAGLARRYLPGLQPEPVHTERCVYDNTPDEDFIVDRVGNVVVGCGTSGHGFKFGPLLGEWLADLATTGDPGPAARRFALRRFRAARGATGTR
jgi:sarcosine oxidase